jgi:hypothetical protein
MEIRLEMIPISVTLVRLFPKRGCSVRLQSLTKCADDRIHLLVLHNLVKRPVNLPFPDLLRRIRSKARLPPAHSALCRSSRPLSYARQAVVNVSLLDCRCVFARPPGGGRLKTVFKSCVIGPNPFSQSSRGSHHRDRIQLVVDRLGCLYGRVRK